MAFNLKDLFSKVDSMAHTFAKYVVTGLQWFAKVEPAIADVFKTTLHYVGPLLTDLATMEFGPAGGKVMSTLVTIAQKLTAVQSLVYDWGVTGGAVAQLKSLLADVQSIDETLFIKSDAAKAIRDRIIKEITGLLDGYEAQQQPPATA